MQTMGMRYHHTKTKGDLGVLCAKVDLVKKGYGLLLPLTEHAPFDLVAFRENIFLRISVKYRTMKEGAVGLRFSSVWVDRRQIHRVPIDKSAIDLVCIYCPDTELCYYVDPRRFRDAVNLRILPPKNRQQYSVHWASDFKELPPSVVRAAERRHARQDSNLRNPV